MPVYVQHEVLGKVNDVFNAEALWQAPALALFTRRPQLRDLLERSPREQRGRAATRCFSHVTLMLPQDEVDDDRHLTRGARVRDLAESLAALHQKDFGDLLGGDEVRYDVVGTEALQPGQVEVKFGHAVYLPAPGEKILYAVSASCDGAHWKPVCALYPSQRLALVGHDAQQASHAVPDWPFGADGAILLINDGAQAALEVQARPKGAFALSFDPLNGYHTVTSRRAGAAGRLLLKVTRLAPAAPNVVWKTRSRTDDGEQTAVPLGQRAEADATFAPLARQCVRLAALALPRMSRYRDSGALALEIGFDRALALAAPGQPAAVGIAVDASDGMYALTEAGRERVNAPACITPADGPTLKLLAVDPGLSERYAALLCLPQAEGVAVASGVRLVFGRNTPVLAALRVLDSPRFLRRADGVAAASADRLGLSRSAFSFEAVSGGYRIVRQSATQALFHLDGQLTMVAAIVDDAPYVLPAGHHLVAGHYVLRFDA
ncbi:MAG: hypothetical protein V4508_19745 [Pseudomonadota bacterium]